ncbi:galactonate dehydratase [Halanaerobium saccharolyticum]|uniref:Galactonate dehydratase n=1 Tax=Halanaerobium saccharolyticum TaxID=43595 RepID=A0A4R7Z9I6_9FIRM|nr:galactonate dehydratase [Halanaerobium saccharolyticum]RAK12583.1 galactonate dehydratase [Halanaerobium saccharolyticum]TDW06509.1 galactonate dehydratase [Halanaerobium saccharolyticum]TDX61757.1 galactonate dehydratase [Halanaerobium saccharolyticum]
MKIVDVKVFPVKPFKPDWLLQFPHTGWLFVKIITDQGISGFGEATLEGNIESVIAAVNKLKGYLIGKDPHQIEHHWQAMYRGSFYRGGPVLVSAISGLEQAMWDIKGKSLEVPVYELLGGACRNKIKIYAHIHGNNTEEYIASAKSRLEEGFDSIKMPLQGPVLGVDNPVYLKSVAHRFKKVRETVGDGVNIAIDFHGRVGPAMALKIIEKIKEYDPMFIEEPVLPENVDSMIRINNLTSETIATGERLYTKWGFREVINSQAADVLQPDLSHAGGILECKKIAAMAEANYTSIAPHCPLGPVALAAGLQLDACIPNFLIQEHVSLGEGFLKEPFKVVDGYIELPKKPGLGIEIKEELLEKHKLKNAASIQRWYHDDGSVADW